MKFPHVPCARMVSRPERIHSVTRLLPAFTALLAAAFLPSSHAAPVTLGGLQNASAFNRTSGNFAIDYAINLGTQTYEVRLPAGYDPAKTYGLVSFVDWVDPGGAPAAAWQPVLDKYDLIWVGGVNIGNSVATSTRLGVSIMGTFRMTELHHIDPNRVYSVGTSGGAQVASQLVYLRPDVYKGFIGLAGVSMATIYQTSATPWTIIPGWSPPGRLDNTSTIDDDGTDYGWPEWAYGRSMQAQYCVFPATHRFAMITNETDFRRTEIAGIYRYYFLNLGNRARLIVRPGGHAVYESSSFEQAVRYMRAAETKVLHDRFEDANLSTNTDAANTLERGDGFWNRSAAGASVSEVNYSYNSKTQKVLRLTPGPSGAAAVVEAKNRFRWTTADGITLDAKLRAETQSGNNQQVGLHIARGDSDDTPEDNPGLHVYANYAAGVKNRIVFVKADGTAVELARWDHAGSTHPMAMGTGDKLFWYAPLGAEHCAKTLDFRGEDIRLVANNDGFQLTFARPAANLETTFPGKVTLAAAPATLTSGPNSGSSDGEDHRIVLQGRWADLNLASAVAAVDFRHWKLMLSNRAINPAVAAGDALVDEVALWADQEEIHFTGPVITPPGSITVNATSGQGALVPFSVSALDDIDGTVPVTTSRVSGSGFPIGTTLVVCEAVDSHGNRTTAEFTITVLANGFVPDPPPVPAAPVASGAVGRVTLTWAATDYASSHSVYRALSAGGPFTLVQAGIAATTFTDIGLTSGTTYHYRLSAGNAAGESGLSDVVAATPPSGTAVKANNTLDLSDAGSWLDGGRPGPLDSARWDQTVTGSNSSAIGTGLSVAGIVMTNPNGDVAITSGGGGSLGIGASGIHAGAATAALTISAPINLTGNQTWTTGGIDSSTQITVSGVVSGIGGITLASGSARGVSFNAANTFTGGFTVNPGNTVVVGNVNATGSGGNVLTNQLGRGTLAINGGTFSGGNGGLNAGMAHTQIQVNADFAASFTARTILAGAWNLGGATRTASTSRTFGAGTAIGAGGNTSWGIGTVGGVPTTLGNGRLRVARAAGASNFVCFRIADNPSFSGNAGLTIGSGVISVLGNAHLAKTDKTQLMALEVESGGYFALCESSTTRNAEIASITGGGEIGNYSTATSSSGTATLTIHGGSSTARHVFNGRIVNTNTALNAGSALGIVNLIKEGSTTQVLAGANIHTGTTVVNAGALFVNGSISSPSALTVAAAAALGGSGSIASPATIHGTLAPGDGPGTLTLTNSLAMSATGRLQWQLSGNAASGADLLNAAAVTVTSGAKIDLVFNASGSSVAFADSFWQSNREWPALVSTGMTGSFQMGSVSTDANATAHTGFGTFSLAQGATGVTVQWTAYTAVERWRYQYFGTAGNTGDAADGADPDADGFTNAQEFANGTNPTVSNSTDTEIVKADNTTSIDQGGSWVGGQVPGASRVGVWNQMVAGANTVTIGAGAALSGIRVVNPGGAVGINAGTGGNLSIGTHGIDLSSSAQTLAIGAPLVLSANQTWKTGTSGASGSTQISVNNTISGTAELSLEGASGRAVALGNFAYSAGPVTVKSGILILNHGSDRFAPMPRGLSVQSGGTLRLGASNGIHNAVIPDIASGAAFDLNGRSDALGGLAGAGTVSNASGTLSVLTIDLPSSSVFDGALTGNTGLTLRAALGTGNRFTLAGSGNTYNGATAVNAGTLVVNGSVSNASTVTVGASGRLAGIGTVDSATTVQGTLQPGDGVGRITFAKPLAFAATGKLEWELVASSTAVAGGAFDQVSAGSVSVTSGAALNLVLNAPGSTVLFSDVFWSSSRAWPVLLSTGMTGGFSLGTVSVDSAGANASGRGRFSVSNQSGGLVLEWTPYNALETWRLANFGNPDNSGDAADSADPDRDGTTNFAEWALGMQPEAPDTFRPDLDVGDGTMEFVYQRRSNTAGGVVFVVEWSDTLGNDWSTAGVVADPPQALPQDRESVRVVLPAGNSGRRFVRVRLGR